jgi:hypothetical protein
LRHNISLGAATGTLASAVRRRTHVAVQPELPLLRLSVRQCHLFEVAFVENKVSDTATEKKLQNETVTKLRTLSHDLSNYIETIMQASYLLAQAKLDDSSKKWLELVDKASQDAARVNREIREILRAQS